MPESIKKKKKQPEERSIPLPHQTAYLGKGLSVGIGAGLFKASDDCDCLGVWEGQVEYHYKKFITGGIDVRFFGGTLDSDVMLRKMIVYVRSLFASQQLEQEAAQEKGYKVKAVSPDIEKWSGCASFTQEEIDSDPRLKSILTR
jgi:hypothetical protein